MQKKQPLITIDGNDGTGKSTIIAQLREHGYIAQDRGLPSLLTDNPHLPIPDTGVFIILDASIEISRARLALAGRDLTEKYHTVEDLTYYRNKFHEIAQILPRTIIIDTNRPIKNIVQDCILFLQKMQITPVQS